MKASWGKERIAAALELAEANVPAWEIFDREVHKTAADRKDMGVKMIQEFLTHSLAEQKRILPPLLARFENLKDLDINTAHECATAFHLFAVALTLNPYLPMAKKVGAPRLANGAHSVMSRLEADIDAIACLDNLNPHVSKHLQTNWMYHLYGSSCSCHANTVGVFKAFAFHFLFGVWHWTGNHANCRVGSAMPVGHQQGYLNTLLPALATRPQRLAAMQQLFRAMERAARQYSDTRPNFGNNPVATVGPVALPFDPTFDDVSIDVGLTWQQISGPNDLRI